LANQGKIATKYSHKPYRQTFTDQLIISDCSHFITTLLSQTAPRALMEVIKYSTKQIGAIPERLYVSDFRGFRRNHKQGNFWEEIDMLDSQPGDFIFYKKKLTNHALIIDNVISPLHMQAIHFTYWKHLSGPRIRTDNFKFKEDLLSCL
jgi:hypothetical protein